MAKNLKMQTKATRGKRLPIGRPRKVKGVAPDTRGRILKSAAEAIIRQGFEAVTLDEVARGAGITIGTIYKYFDGRTELLYHAVRDALPGAVHGSGSAPPPCRGRFTSSRSTSASNSSTVTAGASI